MSGSGSIRNRGSLLALIAIGIIALVVISQIETRFDVRHRTLTGAAEAVRTFQVATYAAEGRFATRDEIRPVLDDFEGVYLGLRPPPGFPTGTDETYVFEVVLTMSGVAAGTHCLVRSVSPPSVSKECTINPYRIR